ncbi:hypothetical protein M23134_01909 [Microscilla marina ATCC 23134]|uniref:Uncharacterized protein n=2 Tax=Microscilla marina TaxID=1027 RepID=A1ZC78_MICM2|nr:hypothetical protein M23134_01909 [Microscilla marina ATCC 23134]
MPREMVWKVEPKPKKTSRSNILKQEMNELKKEFNKLSQFMVQNMVNLEGELAILKQENERLKNKVTKLESTSVPHNFSPYAQLPALENVFLV